LFIPQIAIELYTVLDKTMIGAIIPDKSEVGYYDQAQKIIKMSMTLVTSIGTVMMPRIASKYAEGDNEGIIRYLYKSFNLIFAFGIPLVAGIMIM
jgi:O-antigen/teichoic acid export membrane protein